MGFLVLDGRGAHQSRAIDRWLRDETPRLGVLFVAASVPPVHIPPGLAKPGGVFVSDIRDQWTGYANLPELERLAVTLFDRANENDIPIVLLSGDVHLGTVACLRSTRPEHALRRTDESGTNAVTFPLPGWVSGIRGAIPRPARGRRVEASILGWRWAQRGTSRNSAVPQCAREGSADPTGSAG